MPFLPSLASRFISRLRPGMGEPASLSELEAMLETVITQARASWPRVALEAERFVEYLAERLPPNAGLEQALRAMHTGELFLAAACVRGDAEAQAALEAHFFPKVTAAATRVLRDADAAAEVAQRLRSRLLLSEAGRPPGLAAYLGQGPLAGWLRAAAVRTALNSRRGAGRQARAEQEVLAEATLRAEAAHWEPLHARHRADFQAALAEAFAALPTRERMLLRLHVVEGMSLERLGTLYRTHKSTVSRWLAQAREDVLEGTRVRLAERLRLSPSELHSVLLDGAGNLEQSLSGLLATRS
ncbi:sigma-70 family RNA polymerase sigma factor [Melittangium boletus]|uniref:Transcriptional regulator n=1 Tax=Melittangium boletus DSM 14713 TaxID=1294270 RepID=A0A250INA7_9BACT|nr:sigma-70 family RNA polymerase sigma factor [Melittangium boletus]ATB33229.1 transcriptional regulator [Melittangium boletus DSM 14713]